MASQITIRPYQSNDDAAVVALWKEVFHDDPPCNEPVAVIQRKLKVQPELFLVGIVDGRLVATVLAGYDGVRGWVHHLAVNSSHRQKGFGRELMHAAEIGLAKMGCPKLNLQVRATNATVVSFYRALGYTIEERTSLGKRLDAPD
jgi:ribosomal protein S18 acetylase RimI-like enzyme